MTPASNEHLQGAFRALADPTRREIVLMLRDRDMTIAEVSQHFDMTRAAVKKHLIVLTEGDLITMRRKGRETFNHLEPQALKPVQDWFEHFSRFWDDKLTALQKAVAEETKSKDKP